MRKSGVCLVLTGAAMWLTGCGMQFGGSSATSGGLAVVDLDRIAAETGKNLQMKENYQIQENSVKQQLAQAKLNATSQVKAKIEEIGDEPTDDQKKELAQLTYGANNALGQLQNQAGTKLNQYMQDQVAKFRTEIKPIALEIATKRGLSVVIPKHEGLLLAVNPGVDITDEVIKAYREKRPAPAPAVAAPATTQKAAKPAAAPARTASKTKETEESTK
jgi:Skp family chaperone for outer membrane proteins